MTDRKPRSRRVLCPRAEGAEEDRAELRLLGPLHDLVEGQVGVIARELQANARATCQMIDDFVRWRLRSSYLRYLLSRDPGLTVINRPVQKYYDARWRQIHGTGSPSGQIQQDCTGKISSHISARKLSAILGKISYYHFGRVRNDIAPPRNALTAIHAGYRWAIQQFQLARQSQFLSIETVCQAVIDLGRASSAPVAHKQYFGIQLARCSNCRCAGRNLPILHHHQCDYLKCCPWCGHHLVIVPYAGART